MREHVEVGLGLVPERVPEEVHLLKSRRQAPPRQGSKVTCRSPRNVILAERERAPFAAHYESLPIGPGYRFANGPAKSLPRACLYVSLPREKERDREGT